MKSSRTLWAAGGGALVLLAVLAMAADSIPHPTPATDDSVSVGNGTKWVTAAVPTCSSSGDALRYNTSTNSFSCVNTLLETGNAFSAYCFDTICPEYTVGVDTDMFLGGTDAVTGSVTGVTCSWRNIGTGGGDIIIGVYDETTDSTVCTCTLGACTDDISIPHSCACAGDIHAGREYVLGIAPGSTCDNNPGEMFCNVSMTGP